MVDGIKFDENVFNPLKAVNELALKNAEKLAQIQVKAVRKNLEVALAAARDALDVKSPEEAQAYFQRQVEVAREVMEAVRRKLGQTINRGIASYWLPVVRFAIREPRTNNRHPRFAAFSQHRCHISG